MAMDQYMSNVRRLSEQNSFEQLEEYCLKHSDVLTKNPQHLDEGLSGLNPQDHAIGILHILMVKLSSVPSVELGNLFQDMKDFIVGCNGEQIRAVSGSFADLCHIYTAKLVQERKPILGLHTLVKAINKVQIHPTQLTSIHSDLCQLALLSKCLKPALKFLDEDISDISKESNKFDVKYFLSYHYYGGMIYTLVKNYDRALYMYEIALTTQSLAVSSIMVECYKKYLLVSLILHGKILPLPKYAPSVISRYIKPVCTPYLDVVNAYSTYSPDELQNVINKHAEVFRRDTNYGLMKQVQKSLYKKSIQRLTKTFVTLSLVDVAFRSSIAPSGGLTAAKVAEKLIFSMINDGEIYATINQRDGMVIFEDNPEGFNSFEMFIKIESEMKKAMEAEQRLKLMDQEIALNPKFIQKTGGNSVTDSI